ncbi:DGQHR domain-containing protein [Dehalococcoides mccartyi]|uniref:DGQHR domain-containing protein n=1 Tax=Dehalococcoides mccartyi TaxID=61435 RepID=A0A142VAF4_9CHLR|nr:DGQHR domain-containing protein [Dehalococcoides mccartyi]AGG07944.1 DGQHR domain-containing protein [Dehalococcoides mccartyi BTF08]AMU86639.1 DGQHR domain-containing protein [Dehalococcoides mccartyi]
MLTNVDDINGMKRLAKQKNKLFDQLLIKDALLSEMESKGWKLVKRNKSNVRIQKPRLESVRFEDRVWLLLYKLGFSYLSSNGGASLSLDEKKDGSTETQINIVAVDDEVALAIECRTSERLAKRPQLCEELEKHTLIRERFANAIRHQYTTANKKQVILAMFLSNIILTDNDRERAENAGVIIFDNKDLAYYEALVKHLGPAARYQFLSDMIPNKPIPGLQIRVPAIRTKMGGFRCYTFSVSPEYLLKIAYVSHRAKGKESDVKTYQRMISKRRLTSIREHIHDDKGIFPTNIVINLGSKPLFEQIQQKTNKDELEKGVLGWLDLKPTYKSAWIIDGQHRLYAYSGLQEAKKALLSVLAFEELPPSKQAELFIDINAKQKSVKSSLLQELYAELHWDADDPEVRIRAIISKAIQDISNDPECKLFQRIQTCDTNKDKNRCITLTSIFSTIERAQFYIQDKKHGDVSEYGPLWADTNDKILKRTEYILKKWFDVIYNHTQEWWDKGSDPGGGLAMNDGISTCIFVLQSVFQSLIAQGHKLGSLNNEKLFMEIEPYGNALGNYLGTLTEAERKAFRALRAAQGIITRTRQCQKAIREAIPSFNPNGLEDFIQLEKKQTNLKTKEVVDHIENNLKIYVMKLLKGKYGEEEAGWWTQGVPKALRQEVVKRYEEDDGKRGGKEYYFNLIDYRSIILSNWAIFKSSLGFGKSGNKEEKTKWLVFVNEKRNIVSHSSSGVLVSIEDYNELAEYDKLLSKCLSHEDSIKILIEDE